MDKSGIGTLVWFKRLLVLALAALALFWFVGTVRERIRQESFAGVGLTGVHHLGPAFNIAEFYVDGYYGSNVGREGGGGGTTCCVILPKKWRPGLSVEVRWSVNDWTHENRAEIEASNYDSVSSGGGYIARVPTRPVGRIGPLGVLWREGGRTVYSHLHFSVYGKFQEQKVREATAIRELLPSITER